MRTYELALVADPRLSDDDVTALSTELKQLIASRGGEVLREESWGRRKLAYPIRKLTEGRYLFLFVQIEPAKSGLLKEVEMRLNQNDKILRYLTVRTDEDLKRAAGRAKPGEAPPRTGGYYDVDPAVAAAAAAAATAAVAATPEAAAVGVTEAAAEVAPEVTAAEPVSGAEAAAADTEEARACNRSSQVPVVARRARARASRRRRRRPSSAAKRSAASQSSTSQTTGTMRPELPSTSFWSAVSSGTRRAAANTVEPARA